MSDYDACREVLLARLAEPAPGRIQLVSGPRQVGKTTLLLEIAERHDGAHYAAADGPEAALPGFWERFWSEVEAKARSRRPAVALLDEIQLVPEWSARLKGEWDRLRRRRIPVHVVATGSSALRLASGSKESLAGRFERLVMGHWTAASLARAFGIGRAAAAELVARRGAYPGAFLFRDDVTRWTSYVRDAILEPAIGRDILALAAVRKPGLLRQVFGVAIASPAQIVSLQKIQGQLQDAGALETIAHYLALLEEAFLVAAIPKYSPRLARQRASPPKLVTLSNALLAAGDPRGVPAKDEDRFGAWVENACLAHAWGQGQTVAYWREEPYEVDGVVTGSWGAWAIEFKTGPIDAGELRALGELTRRFPTLRPLVVCDERGRRTVDRTGIAATHWRDFLLEGPPR